MRFSLRLPILLMLSSLGSILIYYLIFLKLSDNDLLYKVLAYPYSLLISKIPDEFHSYLNEFYFVLWAILIGIIFFLFLEISYHITKEKRLTSRGSARWAESKDLKELFTDSGVPIGKFKGKILHLDKYHLVTCAGTRSGKGIGAIIPTLLEYPESVFCLDIKGENYAVTGKYRSKISKCYVINPFGVLGIKSNSYNWLDSIDIDDESCIEKANKIASMLVGFSPNNSSNENHFDLQAIRLLQGVILYVCCEQNYNTRNISTVSKLIHEISLEDLCKNMINYKDEAFGVISSIGNQFLNNANEKELGSILSTAQRATNFLDNPNIVKTLVKSDFNISQLPDKLMSVYLIISQDKIDDFQAYIRVFIELALSSIISRKNKGKYNVLFMLDEVAQLGYMKSLANAVSILRGMGGQLWFFFQSYAQIKNNYGKDADNLLSNSAQIFYGCNDLSTAKLISETLGKETIIEHNKNNNTKNIISRDLLSPNEIMERSATYPIIKIPGLLPIQVKRLCYYKDKEYKNKFSNNPYIDT